MMADGKISSHEGTSWEPEAEAVCSTPVSKNNPNIQSYPIGELSYNFDVDDRQTEIYPSITDPNYLENQSGEVVFAEEGEISMCTGSGMILQERDHLDHHEENDVQCSSVKKEEAHTDVDALVVNETGKSDFQGESVDFKTGIHCNDVPSALEILRTHYKLADVKFRRHSLSWSSWNIADMVRGPHRESYYWRDRRGERITRRKVEPVNYQPYDDIYSNCEPSNKSDVLTSEEEIEEICSKIESKDKEIALMLKKILDQDEERSKDLELLTVKTEPSNTLNRRTNLELNASSKRRENAFQRLMRAIRRRFSSRGRTSNKSPKEADNSFNTESLAKTETSRDRLSLGGSFRQKFNLRRSNSERAQKSSNKSLETASDKNNKIFENKEKKKPIVELSNLEVPPGSDKLLTDNQSEITSAADILIRIDPCDPLPSTTSSCEVQPTSNLLFSEVESVPMVESQSEVTEQVSEQKLIADNRKEEIHKSRKEEISAGLELLMQSETAVPVEGKLDNFDFNLSTNEIKSSGLESSALTSDVELKSTDCINLIISHDEQLSKQELISNSNIESINKPNSFDDNEAVDKHSSLLQEVEHDNELSTIPELTTDKDRLINTGHDVKQANDSVMSDQNIDSETTLPSDMSDEQDNQINDLHGSDGCENDSQVIEDVQIFSDYCHDNDSLLTGRDIMSDNLHVGADTEERSTNLQDVDVLTTDNLHVHADLLSDITH